MSVAHPNAILRRGNIHPAIRQAARIIQRSGWRVTSVFRPTGVTHPKGIALDCAPLTYTEGGFGPKTALLVHQLIKRHLPKFHWLAVAELDHIHLQLFDGDAIGVNTPTGTIIADIGADGRSLSPFVPLSNRSFKGTGTP